MQISHNHYVAYLRGKRFSWKWLKITLLWKVSPCSLIQIHRRFREAYYLHLQDRRVIYPETHFTETSVHFCQDTRCRIQLTEVPLILWNRITSPFFWDVAPRRWAIGARRFETACKFRLQMSKRSHFIKNNTVTHRHIREERTSQLYRCESLSSYASDCSFVRGVFYVLTLPLAT